MTVTNGDCTKWFHFPCKIQKYKSKCFLGSYLSFSDSLATKDLSPMSVGHLFQHKYTTVKAWFEIHHRHLRQEHIHHTFLTFCASLLKALPTFSRILSFFFSISVEGNILRARFCCCCARLVLLLGFLVGFVCVYGVSVWFVCLFVFPGCHRI